MRMQREAAVVGDTGPASRQLKWFIGAVLFFCALDVVILNALNSPYVDDWWNTLHSWSDVWARQVNLYTGWTGRVLSSFLLGVFLLLPDAVYVVANMAVTLAVCFLLARLALGAVGVKKQIVYTGIAYLLLWFFLPAFGEVMVWRTGAIVYLWTALCLLLWLLPFRALYFAADAAKTSWPLPYACLYAAFSLAAGTGIENTGFCAFLMGLCVVARRLYRCGSVPGWAVGGLAAFLAGWLLLILAPGNAVRALQFEPLSLGGMAGTAGDILEVLVKNGLFYVGVAVIAHGVYRAARGTVRQVLCRESLFVYSLFFFFFLNTGALVFSPFVPPRALSGSFFLLVCGVLAVIEGWRTGTQPGAGLRAVVLGNTSARRYAERFCLVAFSCVLLIDAAYSVRAIRSYASAHANYVVYMDVVSRKKAEGVVDVVLPELQVKSSKHQYRADNGLSQDPLDWKNKFFAEYCGLNSVLIEGADK